MQTLLLFYIWNLNSKLLLTMCVSLPSHYLSLPLFKIIIQWIVEICSWNIFSWNYKLLRYKFVILQHYRTNHILCSTKATIVLYCGLQTFEKKLEEQSRVFMAWVRGAIYTSEKRDNLVWLLEATLLSLETASKEGDKFGFVPEYYLDTLFEICSALRNFFNPTLPLEELPGKCFGFSSFSKQLTHKIGLLMKKW